MKLLRRVLITAICLTVTVVFSVPAFAGNGTLKVKFSGHMTGTTSNTCYYAVGIDGGGPIYKYNTKTKKKVKIASGKWCWLNQSGKYLYLTKNKWKGSDARSYYVYRMKKNGKGQKKLANGYNPVVRGKYIYYFGVKKVYYDGHKVDGKVTGIYRMNKDGSNKKRLVKFSESVYPINLGVTKKSIVWLQDGEWKKYHRTKKTVNWVDADIVGNIGFSMWDYYYDYEKVMSVAKSGKYYYRPGYDDDGNANNKLYRGKGLASSYKKIASFKYGTISKVIVSGNQLMVVTETQKYYRVYIMKKSGKAKKLVKKGYQVSGGWDY